MEVFTCILGEVERMDELYQPVPGMLPKSRSAEPQVDLFVSNLPYTVCSLPRISCGFLLVVLIVVYRYVKSKYWRFSEHEE